MSRHITWAALAALALLTACGSSADDEAMADEVQQAVEDSYGPLDHVTDYSGQDAPRITVVTDLADKPENEETAMDICMTVASVGVQVEDFTGVYVTAGEGGAFLAECDAVR